MGKPVVRKIGKLNKYHRMRNNNITNVDNKLKKIMVEKYVKPSFYSACFSYIRI